MDNAEITFIIPSRDGCQRKFHRTVARSARRSHTTALTQPPSSTFVWAMFCWGAIENVPVRLSKSIEVAEVNSVNSGLAVGAGGDGGARKSLLLQIISSK